MPNAQDHWTSCSLFQEDGALLAGPEAIDANDYVEFDNVTYDLFVLEVEKVEMICRSSTMAVKSGTPDRYAGVLESKSDIEFEDANGNTVRRINHVTGLGTYVDVLDRGDLIVAFNSPAADDIMPGQTDVLLAEFEAFGFYEDVNIDELPFRMIGHPHVAETLYVVYTDSVGNLVTDRVFIDGNGNFRLVGIDALADRDGELIQVYADISPTAQPGEYLQVVLETADIEAIGQISGERPNQSPASDLPGNTQTVGLGINCLTLTRSTSSPFGNAVPGYHELLRFNATANPLCSDVEFNGYDLRY